jgi:DNA-binding XRE family transcriptional regulator
MVYIKNTMTGKGLRAARKKLSMTQTRLADAIGMRKNSVARMERDEAPVMKTTELAVKYLLLVKESKPKRRA